MRLFYILVLLCGGTLRCGCGKRVDLTTIVEHVREEHR